MRFSTILIIILTAIIFILGIFLLAALFKTPLPPQEITVTPLSTNVEQTASQTPCVCPSLLDQLKTFLKKILNKIAQLFSKTPAPGLARPLENISSPEQEALAQEPAQTLLEKTQNQEARQNKNEKTESPEQWQLKLLYQSQKKITLAPSEQATVFASFQNTGTAVWTSETVFLNIYPSNSFPSPLEDPSWVTSRRGAALKPSEVPGGALGTFTFLIKAPAVPGIYEAFFRPVYLKDGAFQYLGENPNLSWIVKVEKQASSSSSPSQPSQPPSSQILSSSTPADPQPISPSSPSSNPSSPSQPPQASSSTGGSIGSASSPPPSSPTPPPAPTPSQITDLLIHYPVSHKNSITLSWSTPSNAFYNNNAFYDLRLITMPQAQSSCVFTETEWPSAAQVSNEPTPSSQTGQKVNFTAPYSFTPDTLYCLGIKTFNGSTTSILSNIVSFKVNSAPTLADNLTGQNTTWTLDKSPYIIGRIVVTTNMTLTIEPGVVIKGKDPQAIVIVSNTGKLTAQGTLENPIVFTDLRDDQYAGDTNNDGGATSPSAKAWQGILFEFGGGTSQINNILVRYGGSDEETSNQGNLTLISTQGLNITNVTLDHGDRGLVLLNNSSLNWNGGNVSNNQQGAFLNSVLNFSLSNVTLNNNAAEGLYAEYSTIALTNNQFTSNGLPAYLLYTTISGLQGNTVSANALNGIKINGAYSGTLFNDHIPYILERLVITTGLNLTIQPGVIFKASLPEAVFMVSGTGQLTMQGTAQNPIVFTEIRDDQYGGDTNNDGGATLPSSRAWGGVFFNSSTVSTNLEHIIIRYGGYDLLAPNPQNLGNLTLWLSAPVSLTNFSLEYGDEGVLILQNTSLALQNGNISFNQTGISAPVSAPQSISLTAASVSLNNNTVRGATLTNASLSLTNNQFIANNEPLYLEDVTLSQYSQNTFSANALSAVILNGELSGTLPNSTPYVLQQVAIGNGDTLTIEPGVIFRGANTEAVFMVTGTGRVLASGTAQSPIVFTSFGDDQYGGDIDNDGNIILLAPRAWKGVMFNSGGVGSTLNNVIIRYGGYDSGVPSSGDLTFYFFTGDYSLLTYLTLEYGDQGVYWSFSSPPNISTWTFHNNGIDIEPALP